MNSVSSLKSLSCSLMSENTSLTSFIFLSPCPHRLFLTSIDTLFLLILFIFILQKLYSKLTSHNNGCYSTINEPLIARTLTSVKINLWFKLSLISSTILALLAISSSILAFIQNTETPWNLINGTCWLIHSITFIIITVLILHEKNVATVTHPVSLRVFWILNFIAVALTACSSITRLISKSSLSEPLDWISSISLPFSCFFLIVSVTGSTGITVTPESKPVDEVEKSSGWASASFVSKLFWFWMNPLLGKGYKTHLQLKDVPTLSPEHRAEKMSLLFEQNWPKVEENSKNPVRTTLIHCFWKHIMFTGMLAITKLCVGYVGPLLIKRFVDFTSGKGSSPYEGYYLVLILLVAKFIEVLASNHFIFFSKKTGMLIRSTLITSLYKKGLKLSCSARQSHGVGQIVNHMAVDAQQLSNIMDQIHAFWIVPRQVSGMIAMLYAQLGSSTFVTLIAVVLILWFVYSGTKRNNRYQLNIMKSRDSRLKATNEMSSNMRVIKFQAWEEHFNNRIRSFRESEYGWICKFMYTFGANMTVSWTMPLIISTVTFGSGILLGVKLDAGTVFTATSLFKNLQEPVYSSVERHEKNDSIVAVEVQNGSRRPVRR